MTLIQITKIKIIQLVIIYQVEKLIIFFLIKGKIKKQKKSKSKYTE